MKTADQLENRVRTDTPQDEQGFGKTSGTNWYQDLFDSVPVGIFQTSTDGKLLAANRVLVEMLGFDPDKDNVYNDPGVVSQLTPEPERCREIMEKAARHGTLLTYKQTLRRKDGTGIDTELRMRAACHADATVAYLEGFVRPDTAENEIVRTLIENEKHYKSIFEITGAGTIIIENDMTISLANAGFERISGFSKDEIEGKKPWPDFIAFDADRERMMQYHRFRRQNAYTAPTRYEFTLKDKSGRLKTMLLSVDMIPGTTRSVASLIDITSVKDAEKSLRESESRLSGIIEAFDGFIYTCSREHRIGFMNNALARAIGYRPGEGPCHRVLFRRKEKCPWCPTERVFNGETVQAEFENPNDGRWYYAMSTPVYSTDETVEQCQTILIDIHERKQREFLIQEREARLEKENRRLRETPRDRYRLGDIVGKSEPMQKVYELILRAAATSANVIIYGESGTGKELAASAIHKLSERSANRFIPVNCGAIPSELLESEFFGYRKGAFTGADKDKPGLLDLAENGTLFLDELAEISTGMQVKLLRAIEGGGYTAVGGSRLRKPDVRIIAATNGNLRKLVETGAMREDFFYRIHIIPIYIPPLRERKEDIPLLAEYFMERIHSSRSAKPQAAGRVKALPGHVLDPLMSHHWPGNIRELENTLQRFVDLGHIDFADSLSQGSSPEETPAPRLPDRTEPLRDAMSRFERSYLLHVLEQQRWNRSRAAEILGVERKTLYLKLKKLGIG